MHSHSIKEAMAYLKTTEKGLKTADAAKRLAKYGLNEIKPEKKLTKLKLFISQFKDPIVYVLLAAIILSLLVHKPADAAIIGIILIINSTFGFIQEYRAEQAIALLKKFETVNVRVIRDGIEQTIDAKYLVPGDAITLEAGDKVPADARIFWSLDLETNEAVLTGESEPVGKSLKILQPDAPLAERTNMVFSGTVIVRGRAKAIVTATNDTTEIGKIAILVKTSADTITPLQKRLHELGKWLTVIAVIASAVIIPVGLLRHLLFYDVLMQAVSLAVSAIPEGLPAVVTVCLALGVRRMVKRKAIVKRLKSVETLGSVTVICSDKTGTITKNEMTVTEIFANGELITVSGSGYSTKGGFSVDGKKLDTQRIRLLLKTVASCNNATLEVGDPTEIALLVAAKKAGVQMDENRISEVPFTSDRKYMLIKHNGAVYVKGALEKVLEMCSHIIINGKKRRILPKDIAMIGRAHNDMASKALRVLAVASGPSEKELAFLGLVGMIDPPRPEIKDAIKLCRLAGIRPVMITGDHRATAIAVARAVGITGDNLIGEEIDKLSDEDLRKIVGKVSVYCRTSSEHKVRILEALQANGEVVAMTGDGVNDAPALKKADIGVAMNIKGTDVSKEVADIILVDDNFASIVGAVREGRVIYANIKKFIKFLLSANFDEIAIIVSAVLFGLPLPLLPVQILWINLMTDGLPALALGVDPAEPGIMALKPRPPKESIFKGMLGFLITATLLAFAISFAVFLYGLKTGSLEHTRTLVLSVAIFIELFLVFNVRSERSAFSFSPFSNRWLLGAVASAAILHLSLIYSPLAGYFGLVPLSLMEVLALIGLSSLVFVIFESWKIFREFVLKK